MLKPKEQPMLHASYKAPLASPMAGLVTPVSQDKASPKDIRWAAAQLCADDRFDEAATLTRQGLTLYPRSEDLWAMLALLHEVAQEWQQAAECIENLLDIQGTQAPAETWGHWVRVLRCLGDDQSAFEAVQKGIQRHPLDSMLISEHATLEALLNTSALRSAA